MDKVFHAMLMLVTMDVRQTIGLNIKRLRVEQGIAQEKLALMSGIDRAYMGRIERGSENVTVSRLEAISETLGVHVSALFQEIDKDAPPIAPLKAGRKTGWRKT